MYADEAECEDFSSLFAARPVRIVPPCPVAWHTPVKITIIRLSKNIKLVKNNYFPWSARGGRARVAAAGAIDISEHRVAGAGRGGHTAISSRAVCWVMENCIHLYTRAALLINRFICITLTLLTYK